MFKHLQDRKEYEDRYDRMTVESCRRREQFFLEQGDDDGDAEARLKHHIAEVGWSIEKTLITLDWYNKRESTIKEWMDADKAKDDMLEAATAPKRVYCDTCSQELFEESRTTWDREGKEEVLYFMKCSGGHLPMKGVFTDGIHLKFKDKHCPECNGILKSEKLPGSKDEINTKYSCESCSFTETDSFTLSANKNEHDPEYDKDRARFCLSGDALKEVQESAINMENMKRLVDGWKHEEEHKEEYDAIAKLEKLTIPQVKERISIAIKDTNYLNLTFEKPSIEKYVSIEFSVEELETDNKNASEANFKKLVRKALQNTNWRLMTDGITYRLGLMTGRLRAYESKEDMLKLIK